MAGHLSKNKDVSLSVFNRTKEKADKWHAEFGSRIAASLTDEIGLFDVVILCSGQDEDINEIFFDSEKGILEHIIPGATVIDHTTISYDMTMRLHEALQQRGVNFIDAPVSGGEIGAINGSLSVMAGANKRVFEESLHIINSYAKNVVHMGSVGAGQLAKMANQICIAGVLQGLSEALVFSEANDLDVDRLLNAISGGAAGSWQMKNRLKTMHERKFDFGFAIKWMIKDLSYTLNMADKKNLNLKLTKDVLCAYKKLAADGYGAYDTSALILNKGEVKC
jgi:3-hydroxyisobutyrate dehydrogenase